MKVRFGYGDNGLDVELPQDRTTVVEPSWIPAAPDPVAVLRAALAAPVGSAPLHAMLHRGQTVAVSVCDGTRPQPRQLMIPILLDELERVIPAEDIVLLIATGTHRANTPEELVAMLGQDVVDRVRVVNHDSRAEESLRWMGHFGNDVPVWLNAEWVDADVKVTTGFVEPHFFAGFSGGPKMVAPGLAGLQTVLTLHDAVHIGDPHATWGVTEGNPIHDDIRAIAAGTGVDFSFDVLINRDKDIVAAFAGETFAMHREACALARRTAMRPLPEPFDVVVTCNNGFPLDQNLYQAVKGMSAAAQVVRRGGVIVTAAECRDGFPNHSGYRDLLTSAPTPAALLADITSRTVTVPDQWQAQIQARIQADARVVMHSGFLSDDDLRAAHLEPTADIADTVTQALEQAGPDARVCALPEGPMTVPYLS